MLFTWDIRTSLARQVIRLHVRITDFSQKKKKTSVNSVLHKTWSVPLLVSPEAARDFCASTPTTEHRRNWRCRVQHRFVHHVNHPKQTFQLLKPGCCKMFGPNVCQVDRRVDFLDRTNSSVTKSLLPEQMTEVHVTRSSRSTSLNHPDRGCTVQLQHDSHRDAELIVDSTEPDCFIDHGGCSVKLSLAAALGDRGLASRVDTLHCPIDRQDSTTRWPSRLDVRGPVAVWDCVQHIQTTRCP